MSWFSGVGTWRRPRRRRPSRLEFADLEDFGAAVGAHTLDRRAAVFHRHLLRVLDLDLLPLFDAVALRHRGASFGKLARCARWIAGDCSRVRGREGETSCGYAQYASRNRAFRGFFFFAAGAPPAARARFAAAFKLLDLGTQRVDF